MAAVVVAVAPVAVGELVVADLNDGSGVMVGTIRLVEYGYSRADGEEHTFVTIEDQDGGHVRLTLDELRTAERAAATAMIASDYLVAMNGPVDPRH